MQGNGHGEPQEEALALAASSDDAGIRSVKYAYRLPIP